MNLNSRRILFMLLGNILCGYSVGLFQFADFGIDPFTLGLMSIWHTIGLLDYGTFYLLFSFLLLLIDFFFMDRRKIGLGTITNMFLCGYAVEFSYWMWHRCFPDPALPLRILFLLLALILLCFSSALYYVADCGVSPYDAIPLTLSERSHYSFRVIRISADCFWAVIGLLGQQHPGPATLLIAFGLGPLIEFFRPFCQRLMHQEIHEKISSVKQ